VQEQAGAGAGAAAAAAAGGRRPGQEASFESRAKELPVAFPPAPFSMCSSLDSHGFSLRFRSAVPLSHASASAQPSARGKKAGKRAKSKAFAAAAAAAAELDRDEEGAPRLGPADIPRARLFLCHDADVKDGQLPAVHVEVDACVSLSVAVLEFQKVSRSSKLAPAKPHSGHQWYATRVQRGHACSCAKSLSLQHFPKRLRRILPPQNHKVRALDRVACRMSHVTYQMSNVTCRMSHTSTSHCMCNREQPGPHWSCCDQPVALGIALHQQHACIVRHSGIWHG